MDPLASDSNRPCPLHAAIAAGDKSAIETWLQEGMSPDARSGESATPVQLAIEAKNLELVKLFTVYGADLAATTEGANAYHYAAKSTPQIMSYLLEQPARAAAGAFYVEDRAHLSVLRIALREGDREMTTLLLDYGLDPNEADENGETALHFLLGHRQNRESAMQMTRLLLDRGADIGAKAANFWDETPLFSAVRDSFTEGVRLLLDLGCDAAEKNHLGDTLLHAAAGTWDAKVVRMLLDHGAKIDEPNRIGRTALHVAAHANKLEVVKTLLESGADPFAKDRNGKTPDELCLADFQKNAHREILYKQMEIEARGIGRRNDYYSRRRHAQHGPPKNRSFRNFGNRP
jgi:ankyrin repeat protein